MGGFLILIGLIGFIVGVVSLFRPIRALRIKNRKQAAVVVGVSFVVLLVGGALIPVEEDVTDDGGAIATTTTTTEDTTTTTTQATTPSTTTTTTVPTTTTTLPPILVEGSGHGDDVVEFSIDGIPVIVTFSHVGSANFVVWSLDADFENVDLLVNTIGGYDGTRPMQFLDDEQVAGFEISADGDWSFVISPLQEAQRVGCPFDGDGDDVVIVEDFVSGGGAATLSFDANTNFAIWAWGTDDRDLIVNDIGPYEGTVRVSSGLDIWDITGDGGSWTVDCE